MLKKIAEFVSFGLNPIFLCLILVLLGIQQAQFTQTQRIFLTFLAATINGLLPVGFVFYLSKKGRRVDDVLGNEDILKNRSFVLIWGIVILFAENLFLYFLGKPQPLFTILLTLFLIAITLFLVNLYGKISIHITVVTTFCQIIMGLFGRSFWPVLCLIPITAWSRFILLKHTKKQLFVGFLAASGVTLPLLYYFKDYFQLF